VEPALDLGRALALAVVHDAPEALVGDLPRQASALLPEGAKRTAEERAAALLFADLPESLELWREYHACRTREARFVRVCDKLHLGVMAREYARAGTRGLEEFRAGLDALEAGEFAPCERLRVTLLEALDGELGFRETREGR
jgi:putative hydrolase of HD superfamily